MKTKEENNSNKNRRKMLLYFTMNITLSFLKAKANKNNGL